MSLRAFHVLFIAVSVILAAFVAAWAGSQYRVEPQVSYVAAAVASLVLGVGMAVYGAAFLRKTRNL